MKERKKNSGKEDLAEQIKANRSHRWQIDKWKNASNKSYAKKETALFAKINSRRLQRWYNNRLSKIDSQERIWLIVFTRPSKNKNDWKLKFWVWDSEKDIILGENVLFGYIFPGNHGNENETKSILDYNVSECYIERKFDFVVFRYRYYRTLLMFNFKGELIVQTDNLYEKATGDEIMFSKFLNKKLIFSKAGDRLELFYLDEINGIMPTTSAILFDWDTVYPKNGDIQVILDSNYCLLCGYDKTEKSETKQDTIWLYSPMSVASTPCKGFNFKIKFTLDKLQGKVETKETDEELIISLQGNLADEKVEIKIPRILYK